VWEKVQYEPADVVGPPNDINGGLVVNQVTTVRLTEPTRNVTWCEVPTYNGHGDFLTWVGQLEEAHRDVQKEFQLTPETLEFFLTGKALMIYERLIASELDNWEVCKAEMAKRLARKTEADLGLEPVSWVNIAANPVEVRSSRVVGVHSRDLLLQLKPRVKDDQLALEIWCELMRRVKTDDAMREEVRHLAAQESWDARVNAE
jgi:hypothetical protein